MVDPTHQAAQTTQDQTAAQPQAAIPGVPTVEDMQSQLSQSGSLLPGLQVASQEEVDTSPLAALQPQNLVQTEQGPQPMYLPSQQQAPLQQTKLATTHVAATPSAVTGRWLSSIKLLASYLIVFVLTAQALYNLYESIRFVFVDYPQLEAQLLANQITQTQVNQVGIKAFVLVISTLVGAFFALRIFKSKAGSILNIAVGIGFFVGSAYLNQYLSNRVDVVMLLDSSVQTIQTSTERGSSNIIELLPFLENTEDQQLDVVWYE